jgi:hypothetical protein
MLGAGVKVSQIARSRCWSSSADRTVKAEVLSLRISLLVENVGFCGVKAHI